MRDTLSYKLPIPQRAVSYNVGQAFNILVTCEISFVATLILSGSDPHPDDSFCGSEIEVEVEGESTIGEGGQWKIDRYQTKANIIDFV